MRISSIPPEVEGAELAEVTRTTTNQDSNVDQTLAGAYLVTLENRTLRVMRHQQPPGEQGDYFFVSITDPEKPFNVAVETLYGSPNPETLIARVAALAYSHSLETPR